MSRNIYDLFNERKNGVDYLVEGVMPNDVEAFEDLDAAIEALDAISLEASNDMIEFQAACYLEDLVLENMMYDEFDEEKIGYILEEAKAEKKEGFAQKIKNLWQKIKDWFASAFKTIVNHFQSGEALVAKYRKEIPQAMYQSKAKISMKPFKDPADAINAVNGMIDGIKLSGAESKEQVLSTAGVSDKSGVKERVEGLFYDGKEKVEKEISKMKPDPVIKWASNKKIIIDGLKKQQKDTDGEFKAILAELNGSEAKNASEKAANFQFGIGIVNAMFNAEIACVRDISNACTAIIRKALSGKYDAKGPDRDVENKGRADEDTMKAYNRFKKGFDSKTAAQMATKKLEAWEIIDEEENNNDDNFEW